VTEYSEEDGDEGDQEYHGNGLDVGHWALSQGIEVYFARLSGPRRGHRKPPEGDR